MATVNIARPMLGELYSLYCGALGSTMAWWLGHLTLIAIVALISWVLMNWSDISYGLEINGMRLWTWMVFILLVAGQTTLYMQAFSFPLNGAFITALSVSVYLWWSWYNFEPTKA